MYTRAPNRRTVMPPPDYSGVLFNENKPEEKQERNVTLPLNLPEPYNYGNSTPRYPLSRRRPRYTIEKEPHREPDGLREAIDNKIPDELLLAALILLMIENGTERTMIILLGYLLV